MGVVTLAGFSQAGGILELATAGAGVSRQNYGRLLQRRICKTFRTKIGLGGMHLLFVDIRPKGEGSGVHPSLMEVDGCLRALRTSRVQGMTE